MTDYSGNAPLCDNPEDIPIRILRQQLDVMRAYAEGRTPDVVFPSVVIDTCEERVHQEPLTYELTMRASEAAVHFFGAIRDGMPEKNRLARDYTELMPLIKARREAELRQFYKA